MVYVAENEKIGASEMDSQDKLWDIDWQYAETTRFKKFSKNHPAEFKSLFANLDKVLLLLNAGEQIGQFRFAFMKGEGKGVYRIAQQRSRGVVESRLYIHFGELKTIFLLTIGTKRQQKQDIINAQRIVKKIREGIGSEDS